MKRIIILFFTIVKNLALITISEIKKLFKRFGWKLGVPVLIVLGIGGYYGYHWYQDKKYDNPLDSMSLKEAAKVGEVTTHKLVVQIETPKGNPENVKDRYERGDIVLIMKGDHEFSQAEKDGFLILKMDITDTQADILTRALEEKTGKRDDMGVPIKDTVKRRKYTVDLSEIGISNDDEKGRELDEIYKWDIVREK